MQCKEGKLFLSVHKALDLWSLSDSYCLAQYSSERCKSREDVQAPSIRLCHTRKIKEILSGELATPEGRLLLEKARKAGWVDEHYQTRLSLTKSALFASHMAIRLGIKDKWKYFEILWMRKNMRSNYNTAILQKESSEFFDDVKALFSTI